MRDAGIGVEADVVCSRVTAQLATGPAAQRIDGREGLLEVRDGEPRGVEQPGHLGVTAGVLGITAPVDFTQPVVQRLDQQLAPARVVEQVLLEVRVAVYDPDVAQHLVQHARRTPRAALGAQVGEQLPALVAKQPDDDLAIGERRVIVGDLAQPDRHRIVASPAGDGYCEKPREPAPGLRKLSGATHPRAPPRRKRRRSGADHVRPGTVAGSARHSPIQWPGRAKALMIETITAAA